jgi:hypothetical protein
MPKMSFQVMQLRSSEDWLDEVGINCGGFIFLTGKKLNYGGHL